MSRGRRIITTNFDKKVKHALIDRGKTQVWLTEEVNKITGLKSDRRYISKVVTGERSSPRVTAAIIQILGIKLD